MNEDGHTSSIREKILTITVKKGWKPGTKITFPEEGDQGPNNVPGKIPVQSLQNSEFGDFWRNTKTSIPYKCSSVCLQNPIFCLQLTSYLL